MSIGTLFATRQRTSRSPKGRHWRRATSALLVLSAFTTIPVLANDPDVDANNPIESHSERIDSYQPRFGRTRPVIAVVGENVGTELVDFVVPYGVLSRADVADVVTVATHEGPMQMRPALAIQAESTLGSFDERFPDGADYVIVPAVMSMDDHSPPLLVNWIQAQAGKGASVISICDGALTVAKAGLFKGHRATGHWATQSKREHDFPDTQWLKNTRYVADGKVISSAGVTAAIPLSLALVEAIAGSNRASQVAEGLGLDAWSSEHDSSAFHLSTGIYLLAIRNWILPSQEIGLQVAAGVDELALALTADTWSRTYRSRAYAVADSPGVIRTQHGLTLIPDRIVGQAKMPRRLRPTAAGTPSMQVLDDSLAEISKSYGRSTANFVALQLEYPGPQ
ncbi:MAG: DJ-1/PfpI family protein [Povalibacter sp.]